MAAELTAVGDWLAVPSVVILWLAVLLRAPGALRSPQQRGLWLAVATAAAAMTLNLPAVVTYATSRDPDYAHTVGLVRNLIGVLSAGAVLYFVAAATAAAGSNSPPGSARRPGSPPSSHSTPPRPNTAPTPCRRSGTPYRPSPIGWC